MRYTVRQAGAAVPKRIIVPNIGTGWQTVLEAPDFSVPDARQRFAARDPLDNDRRIQPGFSLIEAPMMFHNTSGNNVTVEIRILAEDGTAAQQAEILLIDSDTFLHPAPGQRLLKMDPSTTTGDVLQVRASVAGVVELTSTASEGAAEEHEPEIV